MKLSQGVEWCLHAAVLLAQMPNGETLSRKAIAEHHGLSEDYLAKYLKLLVNADLLLATTGPKGGYRLARPAQEITSLDVVEAIDGTQKPFQCQEIRQRGAGAVAAEECHEPCGIHKMMDEAFAQWQEHLKQTSVADLVKGVPEHVILRNRQRLLNP